ncbi:hypothetical protein AB0H36_47525 [Kribbella sp. NPDC050820]|uniref:hypothetical protein n=1 Tax=Kribbella sp. NPDC050820 TaxID=3155408 RepID=UPI0033D677A7
MIPHRIGELFRHRDVTGTSGTGVVAQITQFSNGMVALCWLGEHPSVSVWDSLEALLAIHGHDGATVIYWDDGAIQEAADHTFDIRKSPASRS